MVENEPEASAEANVAHIRRMTKEELFSGMEENPESEMEEIEVEIETAAEATGASASSGAHGGEALVDDGYDYDVDEENAHYNNAAMDVECGARRKRG